MAQNAIDARPKRKAKVTAPTPTGNADAADDGSADAGEPAAADTAAWLFYARPDRDEGEWVKDMQPGRIMFWRHWLARAKRGGAPYSTEMRRGDTVLVLVGERLVAWGVLAAAREMLFAGPNNSRWWPILFTRVYDDPPSRKEAEAAMGGRLVKGEGTVFPISRSALAGLGRLLLETKRTIPPTEPRDNLNALARGETLAQALALSPEIQPDAATRRLIPGLATVLPTVFNDRANADDLLNIDRQVTAFAQLAISRQIEPPLSIGVFGDWGSGKSFFMEKVHAKIEDLTAKDVDPDLHAEVPQIRFNAWHYIDTNLWASLVAYIFEDLDRWLKAKGAAAKDVDALFDQLSTSRQLKLEAYRELLLAKKDQKKADDQLADAQTAHRAALHTPLSAKAVWRAAAQAFKDGLGKDEVARIAKAAGLDAATASAEDVARLVQSAADTGARGQLVTEGIVRRLGSFWAAAALVFILGGPPLVAWLVTQSADTADAIRAMVTAVSASIAGAAGSLGLVLKSVKANIAVLDGFQAKLDAALATATADERTAVAAAEAAAVETAQKVAEAERRAAAAADRVAAIAREQRSLTASGRINRFIRDKVINGDYARHLGIVANIHKDFSQLSDLLKAQNETDAEVEAALTKAARDAHNATAQALLDEAAKDGVELTPDQSADLFEAEPQEDQTAGIGRIVLYIDDLDRCPPEKVVQVLQAIHMLLFFPLFVVFVAVDARWLRRSLRKVYPELLADPEVARHDPGDDRAPVAGRTLRALTGSPDPARQRYRHASEAADAQDYLEKIFQVPFWVSAMDADQSDKFVVGLTNPLLVVDEEEQGPIDAPPSATGGGQAPPGPGPETTPPPPEEPDTPAPKASAYIKVNLTGTEQKALATFGALLGGSPRRTKRYVNTYLLIKISQTPEEAADPKRLWPIAAMLAIVVGATETAEAFFDALPELGKPRSNFESFKGELADALAGPDGRELGAILDAMKAHPETLKPDLLLACAPLVQRFSF